MQECAIFNPQMQGTNNVSIGCGYKCRWRAVYEEQRDIYARLKACITRQRISFRLFKQWYWESFDKDVQVSPYFGPPLPASTCGTSALCVLFSKVANILFLHFPINEGSPDCYFLCLQNTLRHLYSTTEDAMNSPLPPSPSAYSPLSGQPTWPALNTPSNLQPRLSGSLDAASLANPLSSLRRSIERRNSEREQRRGSPRPGGLIGLALAQYARDAGNNGNSASPLSSAAELAEAETASSIQGEAVEDNVSTVGEPPVSAGVGAQMSELLNGSDHLPVMGLQEEAIMEPFSAESGERATSQQPGGKQEKGEAQGSLSFADAFGHAHADLGLADDASWGQDEGSVSFGTKLAATATPADTPPFCPPPSAAVQQISHPPVDVHQAGQDAEEMVTPGPSSTGSVGMGSQGSFLAAAAQGTPPSTRHSFGPAEAIRSISLMPSSPQPLSTEQRPLRPPPGRLSFRQAHGLTDTAAPPGDTALAASSSQHPQGMHGAGGQVQPPPEQWAAAAEEDRDIVIYDEVSMAAQGSPALSASLQHIFDEALAQADSAGSSPALSSLNINVVTSLEALDSEEFSTAMTSAADNGDQGGQNAGDEAGENASPASSPSLSCYSELSSPELTDSAPEQPTAGSPRLLVLDNPLSVAASPGNDSDSEGGEGDTQGDSLPAAGSPEALLLQLAANPRRSLQSALALAASLGSGILGADPLSPFPGAAPDQGHFVFSPAAGVPGEEVHPGTS